MNDRLVRPVILALAFVLIGCDSAATPNSTVATPYVYVSPGGGIADTFEAIESKWNKGYRHEVSPGERLKTVMNWFVIVGSSEQANIVIHQGPDKSFGTPPRAQHVSGTAQQLLGLGRCASMAEFAYRVRDLMPSDSRVIAEWNLHLAGLDEHVFALNSATLAMVPGVEVVSDYKYKSAEPGDFFIVFHTQGEGQYLQVEDFDVIIGSPSHQLLDVGGNSRGMKPVPTGSNPFGFPDSRPKGIDQSPAKFRRAQAVRFGG